MTAGSGTVAVTGGSGFIGSNVVDALINSGRTIRVIDTVEPHHPNIDWLPDADILDVESLLPTVEGTEAVFTSPPWPTSTTSTPIPPGR